MTHSYHKNFRRSFLLLFLLFTALSFGQTNPTYNKKGEKQGVVRIKVTKTTGTLLKSNNLKTKRGVITTGVSAIDAVSSAYQASNMTRLFPENPNPKLEAKLRKHGLDLWYEVKVNSNEDAASIARKYQDLGEVTIAETERLKVISTSAPVEVLGQISSFNNEPFNDPYLPEQWHYNNTGQTGYPGIGDVNLYKAWEITSGSADVIVSVHDQGIDVEHEDLKENIWENTAELNGTEGVDDDGNGFIDDIHGWNYANNTGVIDAETHGTHVGGTVSAVNNNGIGVAGVAGGSGNNDGAKLMSLQILGGNASAANSYIYAADNGAVISQNSWGYQTQGNTEQAVQDAINYFIAEAGDYPGSPMKGGIVIFASGNANSNGNWYPGYYSEVLTVSSLGPEGIRARYSNYGSWVDISAPGGEMELYGNKNGVLSTLPNNKIGYLEGTSMACPHIAGIAALALANTPEQITPEVLWTKLLTGTVNIDELNPNYVGKLGELSDAYLAIQVDKKLAPTAITNLNVDGMAQEFASISWTVPTDEDDNVPYAFNLYYSTEAITADNLKAATRIELKNSANAGELITQNVENLYGLTTYYFAITSVDRWGNTSLISNVVNGTTNEGPAINVDDNSKNITIDIDATADKTGNHEITILNEAEGILRWNYETRHVSTRLAYNRPAPTNYSGPGKPATSGNVKMQAIPGAKSASKAVPAPLSFEAKSMAYYEYVTNIIGDEDTALPNSMATKFTVTDAEGFNLTDVEAYLKHDPALGPVIVEIYKGGQLNRENLVISQEYSAYSGNEQNAYIKLNEQIFIEQGESFWLVFHVPSGNLYPLGIGPKLDLSDNTHTLCFMSFDMGTTWAPIADLIETKDYVWGVKAKSNNEYLGEYLSLNPDSGEITGNADELTNLTATAETLINGTYKANVILKSNDGKNPELRLPVTLNVSNQQPELSAASTLDFGSVFQGESKEITFTLSNIGLGNFSNISLSSSNPNFELVGYAPWQIAAKSTADVTIKYTPGATTGTDNGKLKIESSSSTASIEIILFGVSTEPGKLKVTPESQTIDNLTIGDVVTANLSIENDGASTLRYFIPGYDTNGISDNWEYSYSLTGYKIRSNHDDEANPIAYEYEDISATGESLTEYFKANGKKYKQIDMGFDFPYFKTQLNQLFITQDGYTTFSDEFNPINTPRLGGAPWSPQGYISPIGGYFDISKGANVYYEIRSDRVIVQYDDLNDGYSSGTISAQMVLYMNGNIRFYYNDVTLPEYELPYLNVLIESFDQTDGILYSDWEQPNPIYTGMALGYDYPGPDIITSITNGSGVLLPGDTAELVVELDTKILNEGLTNRYLNIISSDPENRQKIALIALNVIDGGAPSVTISDTAFDFGTLFQGTMASRRFILKNEGSAATSIASFEQSTNSFEVIGEKDGILAPGASITFDINFPTDVVGDFEDVITITDTENNTFEVALKGSVIDPPAIAVDLSPIDETLNYGEKASHELLIENTGKADLEIVGSGNQWLSLGTDAVTTNSIPNFTYTVESDNTGANYHWLDIRETATQLAFVEDVFNPEEFYRSYTLKQPIKFYGKEYSTIYLAENGTISFEKPSEIAYNPDNIPSEYFKGLIAPFWTFGMFNTFNYTEDQVGLFVQEEDDKTIISWEYLVDNFGGIGDPVSAQVIFYNNGTMKFQYKLNGNFAFSTKYSVIGVQNPDKSDAVAIAIRSNLDFGDGLSYTLSPAEKQIVAPGETLSTYVNIDASSVYAGSYSGILNLRTNVPNEEHLEKPVNLTVNGTAAIEPSVASIDYGTIMSYTTDEGPKSYIREFDVRNTGVAPLNFSGIALEDMASEFKIEVYIFDSWYGWYWSNVDYLWSWPTLQPNDTSKFRITYAPQTVGTITNNVIISSDLEDLTLPLTANVTLPPAFSLETESIYSSIATPNGTDTQVATFNNANGEGELNFELSLDYLRTAMETSSVSVQERMNSFVNNKTYALHSVNGQTKVSAKTQAYSTFSNTLAYEDKDIADTYFGNAGSSNFITATKFNAGAEGFTLSHIQTGIRADELTEGSINYEIRAGGTSPADAISLGSGKVSYNLTGADSFEALLTLELEDNYAIYPNEDFYVILTFPFELLYAQGSVIDVEDAPGRYTVLDGGDWYDLQEAYAGHGWMVRALEETYKTNAWVNLQDISDLRLETGASQNVSLDFFAEFANKGSNYAKLVIKTNDPFTPMAEIPVTLHVNQAPSIANKPELIVVCEGEIVTTAIDLVDEENDELSVALNNAPAWLTYTVEDNKLILTLAPDFDSEGVYDVELTISDSNAASTNATLAIEVMSTNRAPEVLELEDLYFETLNAYHNLDFSQYFEDPDGDDMTYTISVDNTDIVTAFTNGSQFIVQTLLEGTTTLHLTATDSFGATTEAVVNVYVGQSLGINDQDALGLNMYPNPASDVLNITAKVTIETIEIYNINGQLILSQPLSVAARKAVINVSKLQDGVYFVKAYAETGTSNFKFVKQ